MRHHISQDYRGNDTDLISVTCINENLKTGDQHPAFILRDGFGSVPGGLVWTGGVAVAVLVPDTAVRTMNDDLARLFLGDTASGANRLRLGGMGRSYGFALSVLWIRLE